MGVVVGGFGGGAFIFNQIQVEKNNIQVVDCSRSDQTSKQFVVSGLRVDKYKNVCSRHQPHSFCRLHT